MTDFAHLNDYILLATLNCKICSIHNTLQVLTDHLLIKLEIRVSQNLAKLGGEAHKMSGMEGERIEVNCVAREGGFQHWLCKYRKVRFS